jgi:4,4'-diaponeurosporenoate glycosyltransferase
MSPADTIGALVPLLLVAAAVVAARCLLAEARPMPRGTTRSGAMATVSVVVPARNEATHLSDLLSSLSDLDGGDLVEVVVVDDGSTDGTASVARAGGAHVVPAGTPPAGWTGKAWACHVGVAATAGDLLLLLDADTVLAPDALSGLLETHDQHGGLVTVQPHHDAVRPHEQLSAFFNAAAVMASSAFTRVPATPPMAFGPCLLASRADLHAAGGHAAVRGDVLDDAALAAAFHRAGLPVVALLGGTSIRMRSYPDSLRQLVAGWTKNIAAGASSAAPGATLAVVLWVCIHHAVATGAFFSALDLLAGRGGSLLVGHPAAWLLAYVVLSLHLRSVVRRLGSFRWWAWAFFPVPLLVFDLVFARSLAHTFGRRSVTWRGRDVDLRAHAEVTSTDEAL